MRAINHALTGALIGLTIHEPLIAAPAAVASHFICDAIPHYDLDQTDKSWVKTDAFRNLLVGDALLCVALVVVLAVRRPERWLLAVVCAFLAAAPDASWINRYLKTRTGRTWHPGAFNRFASVIQWFARPIGGVVEIVWFIGAVILILPFIRG